jgi:pectate lyase
MAAQECTSGPTRRSVIAAGLAGTALMAACPAVAAAAPAPGVQASENPASESSTAHRSPGAWGTPANGFAEAQLPKPGALDGSIWSEAPTGFASLPGYGLQGTTGGAGGKIIHVRTAAGLREAARAVEHLVVILHGSIVFGSYEKLVVQSHKSFLGFGAGAEVVNAGFKLITVGNVIFRNFTVRDSYIPGDFDGKRPDNDRDGIQVDTSHHIWVDHMFFVRLGDGLVDTRKDCDLVSYSWNVFADHNKALGEGWTANVVTRLTLHHNWIRNTHQRNASIDNTAAAHVYNNLLEDISSYGMLGRNAARMVVEGNYFSDVRNPLKHQGAGGGLTARGNVFSGCTGDTGTEFGTAFDPAESYPYRIGPAVAVPALVRRFAGPAGGTLSPAPGLIRVALDGTGDVGSIRAAVGLIPAGSTRPVTIELQPGVYREPAVIWKDRRNVTLRGATGRAADVVLTAEEGVTLWAGGDGTVVRDLTVTSDSPQDGDVVRTTGSGVEYVNVTVLNGRAG